MQNLHPEVEKDLVKRGYSRRSFARVASLITAGATLPFYNEAALAQGLSAIRGPIPADAVKINANENPLGPCDEAKEAIYSVISKGGRYLYEETFGYGKIQAEQDGVKPNYVQPYAGSSAPLHQAVLAFCSKDKPFVIADPGYEAGARAAAFIGAPVVKVALSPGTMAHDVKKMATVAPNAGLIYVCNPNNPGGWVTKKSDIEWLVENKPAGSVVLLDEAYIHLTNEEFGSALVAKDKDVVILRTFSKLYGMAGLRAGAAIGRPDLLAKISAFGAGALPVTGMVGAMASLKSKSLVPVRRKQIAEVRNDTFNWLTKKGYKFVPSESNNFMIDTGAPGAKFAQAMFDQKILVGRVWSAMPNHVRVSIGTMEEMEKFKAALLKVMPV
jgi:histidinol-phosphate/aromatic aminotransferase/cobyric acid decarboxylase-like protein